MDIKKLINRKQMIIQAVILVSILIIFCGVAYANEGLEFVSIEGGFDGTYKVSGWTPVVITVKNTGEDFQGEVQVLANNERYETRSAYAQSLNLPKNAEKQITINVPVNGARASVDVQLIQGDKVKLEQKYYFKKGLNPNTFIIGALTDDMSGLRYLSGVNFGNQNFSLPGEIVQLNEKNFPDNSKVLGNFNILLINNFDFSTLSEIKTQKLIKWVEDGGLLVLGSGPNYKKVFNSLPDRLKSINIKGQKTLSNLEALRKYADVNAPKLVSNMQVSQLEVGEGRVVVSQDQSPLIIERNFGKGFIGYFAFDLGLEPFSKWEGANHLVWQKLINSTIGVNERNFYPEAKYEYYHSMDNALRYIPSVSMPSFMLLLIVLGAFILIVGPINYLILKKKDKREWAWITIPTIILIFSLGMYVVGFGTRFSSAVCSIISIVEFKNDSKTVDVTAHTGLFNPNRGDLKIETSNDVEVDFTSNRYMDRGYYPRPQDQQNKKIVSKFIFDDQPAVEFYDKGIWDFNSFIMNKNVSFTDGLHNDIIISGDEIKGEIQNNTGFKIKDAFIVIGNSYVKIGDLDITQTKELNERLIYVNNGRNDRYQFMNEIFGQNYRQPGIKIDDEWRVNQQRRSVFEYYNVAGSKESIDNVKPILYGWSDADLNFEVYANGKQAEKFYQNLIIMPLEFKFSKDDRIELPYGFINSKIDYTEGNVRMNSDPYSRGGLNIEGNGKAVFKFSIPEQIDVKSFTLDWYSPHMRFQGNTVLNMYNYKSKEWDEVTSYYKVDEEIISQYISDDNEVKIMFDASNVDTMNPGQGKGFFGMVPMPDIELEGVVK